MIMITPAEFEDKMRAIERKGGSIKECRDSADELMCQVLIDNGYEAGVEIFDKMKKW